MSVTTVEGGVEQGRVRLPADVRLPDDTRVYVVIPGDEKRRAACIGSPHLVHPEQAADFVLEVVEEDPDACL